MLSQLKPNSLSIVSTMASVPTRKFTNTPPALSELHNLLTVAPNLLIWFPNDKELMRYRRGIYSLNKDNAAYKYRTIREGNELIVLRIS